MLGDNTYHAEDQAAWPVLGTSRDAMNVRLNEIDRRAVDMLLSGDAAGDGVEASMLERTNSVRRFLSLLDALPVEQPSTGLADGVLRKIATSQVAPTQSDSNPSAEL